MIDHTAAADLYAGTHEHHRLSANPRVACLVSMERLSRTESADRHRLQTHLGAGALEAAVGHRLVAEPRPPRLGLQLLGDAQRLAQVAAPEAEEAVAHAHLLRDYGFLVLRLRCPLRTEHIRLCSGYAQVVVSEPLACGHLPLQRRIPGQSQLPAALVH